MVRPVRGGPAAWLAALLVLSATIAVGPLPPVGGQSTEPDPTIELSPNCGPVGSDDDVESEIYVIEISGEGFVPFGDDLEGDVDENIIVEFAGATVDVSVPDEGTDFVDQDGRFRATIQTFRRPSGTYVVEVRQEISTRPDDSVSLRTESGTELVRSAEAVFTVPCPPTPTTRPTTTTTTEPPPTTATTEAPVPTPTTATTTPGSTTTTSTTTTTATAPPPPLAPALELVPPLGPTGFVTTAVGTGFPPDVDVTLTWDPGIGTSMVRTDAGGNLNTPVLVLPNDVIGPRALVAAVPPVPGLEVAPVVPAPYLVVPGTVQPPRSAARGFVFRG